MTTKFNFQLYSDIHLELYDKYDSFKKFKPTQDYLILAGDIGKLSSANYKPFIDYCSENWKKTFYILGNHEYYHSHKTYCILLEEYKNFFSEYHNIHLLNNDIYELENVILIGSTLWSKCIGTLYLNDFKQIKEYYPSNNPTEKPRIFGLSLDTFNKLHEESIMFIKTVLSKLKSEDNKKNIIIITHFPPLRENTFDPKYVGQSQHITEYFSQPVLHNLIKDDVDVSNVKCWIFGHTHYSTDFIHEKTNIRIISNQYGYQYEKCSYSLDGEYFV